MRSHLLGFAGLLPLFLHGQPAPAFQQEADYRIRVRLDPTRHTLAVTGTLTYTNHAPETLDSLALHLWANAYADRESPFGQQLRRLGRADFAFAPDEALGGYRDLAFASNGAPLAVRYASPEIAWIAPAHPLAPGDSLAVDFAYELRIPQTFSRMGRDRTGLAYAVTQWFPKPAVYDAEGWHVMPYLDVGEFFSEFGDYDVAVTVPANGVVAATGDLVNDEGRAARRTRIERSRTDTLAIDSSRFAPDAEVTFRYRAEGVHDFAWFVDPRFRIAVDTADLRRGPTPTYAYYLGGGQEATRWRDGARYLARAVAFADSVVGRYPYPHLSAVRGPLGTGGGMEYPMVTVIGPTSSARALDRVLAHEAFHNHFQGLLASNERAHAWMDEGLTSWLEGRYMQRYYPDDDPLPRFLRPAGGASVNYLAHATFASARRAPAPETQPDSLTSLGYGYAAYTQPQLLFDLLDARLGGDAFEARLRDYFAQWAGRHPGPRDLQAALGGEEVAWLFDDLLLDNRLPDYAIASAALAGDSVRVVVENQAGVTSPVAIALAGRDDAYRPVTWFDGFAGTRTLAVAAGTDVQRVAIDPAARTPEIDRDDNYYRLGGGLSPKLEPLRLAALTSLGTDARNVVSLVPALGLNTADRLLLGVGFHTYSPLNRGTRLHVIPQLATRDGSLNGLAGLRHSAYAQRGWWRELEVSLTGRTYHYRYDEVYDYNERFARVTLGGEALLAAAPGLPLDRRIGLRGHVVRQRFAVGIDAERRLFDRETRRYGIVEADYTQRSSDVLRPYRLRLAAQGGEGFARVSGTLEVGWRYRAEPHFVRARLFAGAFVYRDEPAVATAVLLPNGVTGFHANQYDYTFEQVLYDRSEQSQQIFDRDGSLSLPFLLPVPFSDTWLTSVTVTADAPVSLGPLELQAYLDAAVYPDTRPGADGVVAPVTAGGRASLFGGLASVSLAAFNSAFVREALPFTIAEPNYWDRVAFRLDLTRVDVDELLRRARG